MIEAIIRKIFAMSRESKLRALDKAMRSDPEVIQILEDDARIDSEGKAALAKSRLLIERTQRFLSETEDELKVLRSGDSAKIQELLGPPREIPRTIFKAGESEDTIRAEIAVLKKRVRNSEEELSKAEERYDREWGEEIETGKTPPGSLLEAELNRIRQDNSQLRDQLTAAIGRLMGAR